MEIKGTKRTVQHTNPKFPCRSNLEGIPESQDVTEYDINEHITALEENNKESEEWILE